MDQDGRTHTSAAGSRQVYEQLPDEVLNLAHERCSARHLDSTGPFLYDATAVFNLVPKELFFTKGVGKHREKLTSFELALRSAGIAACNLVRVSSIFPPGCRILSRAEGIKRLRPGQVTFVVMSEAATREPHRLIAATVGVAVPRDRKLYGYLSEHHSFGENEDTAGDYAEELAAEMLATTLGLDFDPDKSWDEKKEVYRLSNQIVRTQNVTQTAVGDKKGLWTTVVAAAVLVG